MAIMHKPVMIQETMENLNLRPGQTVLDCTLGTGGHAEEILKCITPGGKLIAIDRDKDSIDLAAERLGRFEGSFELICDDFRNIDSIMRTAEIEKVDAIFFDLGISSYQLENPERGFSFMREGPLDMRMDRSSYISAYDLINSLSETELSGILRTFGQERWDNRIARVLIRERSIRPIATTRELSEVVMKAVPHGRGYSKIHPATRTFMAFRIAVNRELEALDSALNKSIGYLKKGGRIVAIAFHSLEDRIVKVKFRTCSKENQLILLTKKPLRATPEEMHDNARSRSARLRAAERI